jgi:hypothetical protein
VAGALMERRLGRLEVLYQADPRAIEEASYSIEWALKFPGLADPGERAAAIRETHNLDDAGLSRAVTKALVRCGAPSSEARMLAELGLERVVAIAANATEVA